MSLATLGGRERPAAAGGAGFLAEALRVLRAPGPAPRGWGRVVLLLLVGVVAASLLIAVAGWLTRGEPGRYFGEKRPGTWVSVGLLVASAETCRRIHRLPAAAAFGSFWMAHAILFAYLGLDEALRIHEQLDRHAHRLFGLNRHHPVTDHLDDAFILGYAAFAAALWYRRRWMLLRLPWTLRTIGAGFLAFAAMMAVDLSAEVKAVEDSIKLVAASLIFGAFLAASREMERLAPSAAPDAAEQAVAPAS